jgi:hypothetical protein
MFYFLDVDYCSRGGGVLLNAMHPKISTRVVVFVARIGRFFLVGVWPQ